VGGGTHLAAVLLHKAIGGKVSDLKGVSYKGAAEAITNLLGGHIELTSTSAGGVVPHVEVGKLRVVAVAAPRRLGGALADVPTWKEQGADVAYGLWRLAIGPKGMSAAQTAFWEETLRKATQTPEWKSDMEQNFWSDEFILGEAFRRNLAEEYATTKALFVDLGLAKQ
jgi:putative tricarboxylic transport membrane protein